MKESLRGVSQKRIFDLPERAQNNVDHLTKDNLLANHIFGSCDKCGGVLTRGVCNTCRPDSGIRKANKK